MEISLPSGRKIGDGHPPFIIAEVGSNWRTLEDCRMSIRAAKNCGADAVKFQLFTPESLYGFWPKHFASKMDSALPIHWLPQLKSHADQHGIEFMCSAFSPELIEAVDPYVNIHKVASAECTHVRMLEKLRQIGKPVFLSTGAHGLEDIKNSFEYITWQANLKVILMYCVAAYPAQEVDLENIKYLRNRFGVLAGYSDHSLDVLYVPVGAVALGAVVIEKHFTALPELETADRKHSLNPHQFERMVERIRGTGVSSFGWTQEEQPMVLRHNRRLIAIKSIRLGDTLKEGDNFDICRSLKDDTHAFSPFMINEVNGQIAKRDIAPGDGIGPGDV